MSEISVLTAVVICPGGDEGDNIDRRLLGLGVGERLLLALGHCGVARVVFAGRGRRPACDRAPCKVTSPGRLRDGDLEPGFVVLPSDLVFDRGLLAEANTLPDSVPISYLPAERFEEVTADPEGWLRRLGQGHAVGGRGFAVRVTDEASAHAAERSLLSSLRKPIDGFVSRHLNRHVSLFISEWLVGTGVRPNHLTVVFTVIGVLSGVLAAKAEPWWMLVLAGLLFQAQSIFDGCDGEVARLTYRFSHAGQWLDTIGDDLTNYAFCLGLAVGQARVHDWTWMYALGGATFLFQCLTTGIMYRRMIVLGTGDLLAVPVMVGSGTSRGLFSKVVDAFRVLAKRDTFVFVVALLAAVQLPLAGFFVMAAGTYPMFVGVLVNDIRLARMGRRKEH